eukprot:910117-Pleurochrysis_carterae.AAC.2
MTPPVLRTKSPALVMAFAYAALSYDPTVTSCYRRTQHNLKRNYAQFCFPSMDANVQSRDRT